MQRTPEFQLYMGDAGFRWRHVATGRTFPVIGGGDGDAPEAPEMVDIPADLTTIEDPAELTALQAAVQAAVDELAARATSDPESITADDQTRATQLAAALKALNAEVDKRNAAQQETVDGTLAALAEVASPPAAADDGADGTDATPDEGTEVPEEVPA